MKYQTKNLKIAYIVDPSKKDEAVFMKDFKKVFGIINEEYPELDVTGKIVEGVFGSELIKKLYVYCTPR